MAEARTYRLSPALAQVFEVSGDVGSQPLRSLATEIIVRHVDKGRRGLAICGAASGAGVSFVAAGLGLALSQIGVDTLIVDANLRKPSLDQLISCDPPADAGLLQYLRGEAASLDGLVHAHIMPDLSVLYAGGLEPQPQELFDNNRFKQLVGACMRNHQLTIVDTPPASRCAEARRIAAVTGYAVIVGRRDVSYSEDMTALSRDLDTDGVMLVGSILNGASIVGAARPLNRACCA